MPQYWLKPLGTTKPHAPMDPDWTKDYVLPDFNLITGPATINKPPQMGNGDRVLLHAVIDSKLIGEGEIVGNPVWKPHHKWGERFPWEYPCLLGMWVPIVSDGVPTSSVAPKKVMGRIQAGGEYARLTKVEYDALVSALSAVPTVEIRTS